MALSPTAGLLGLYFLFKPMWLRSHVALHTQGPGKGSLALSQACCPATATAGKEALLFLQAHWHACGSLSLHLCSW